MNTEHERAIVALAMALVGAGLALIVSYDLRLLLAAAGFLGGTTGLLWPPPARDLEQRQDDDHDEPRDGGYPF